MIRQQQLLRQIARVVVESGPDAWETLEYRVRALAGYMEDGLYVSDSTGQVRRTFPPDDIIDHVDALRTVMYRPGAGTWFSATVRVNSTGNVSADFDYDNEPAWETTPVAEAYAQDVRKFPRDESAMPAWLRARLAEAAAEASGER